MAKHRVGMTFKGFEDLAARLDGLNGDLKKATEKALLASHEVVTKRLKKAIRKSNLPAKGKYSVGDTEKALRTDSKVEWEGMVAEIKIGFDLGDSLRSIFLMYGTPRIDKDQKLYNAAFGAKTQKDVRKIQEDIFYNEIRRING